MSDKEGTLVWQLEGPADRREWLVAELDGLGFEAFEETDAGLTAYRRDRGWDTDAERALSGVLKKTGFSIAERGRVEAQNWNAAWEARIEPVSAGGFCVHPPWHEPENGLKSICIEPKMSFGTAHHATTRLMLSHMEGVVSPGDTVLDAGTGTGVLAIAARMLGAAAVVGFDIDPWSEENARENLGRNQISNVDIRIGGIEQAGQGPYDVILANINRAVLLDMIPRFAEIGAGQGRVLLSGVLRTDEEMVRGALSAAGFRVLGVRVEDEWIALHAALESEQ